MKRVTAKQYANIHPCLPVQRGNVRISNIDFINAILYVLENGCKWHALPGHFGNWSAVYARFRRGLFHDCAPLNFCLIVGKHLSTDSGKTQAKT